MANWKWKPIEDIPTDWSETLASPELATLTGIWSEQTGRLRDSGAVVRFNERLRREWAIETGIIENLYSIDRGITLLLIEKGIDASLIPHGATDKPAEVIVPILMDHEEALEGLFDFVAQRRELSAGYVKELHQLFTRHQESSRAVDTFGRSVAVPLIRGDWKKLPNNPVRPDGSKHEYCPPEHVASEIDRIIVMYQEGRRKNVTPEVLSAWLHHRFTEIHPFQDGNGRIARALASLIFLQSGWFPLVINRDIRGDYIAALERADVGDLGSLVKLFTQVQKRSFLRALSLSEDVLRDGDSIRQVIGAATERLQSRQRAKEEDKKRVFELVRNLEVLAVDRLTETANAVTTEIRRIRPSYAAIADRSTDLTDFWFRKQVIEVARTLKYFADTRTYRSWVRLKIREDRQADLVIVFHSLGVEFLGVVIAAAFMEYRDRSSEGETVIEGPHLICRDVYQVSYKESEEAAAERFEQWLSESLLLGLDQWRRQL